MIISDLNYVNSAHSTETHNLPCQKWPRLSDEILQKNNIISNLGRVSRQWGGPWSLGCEIIPTYTGNLHPWTGHYLPEKPSHHISGMLKSSDNIGNSYRLNMMRFRSLTIWIMIILVRIILDIHLAIFGIHRNQVNPLFRYLWIKF